MSDSFLILPTDSAPASKCPIPVMPTWLANSSSTSYNRSVSYWSRKPCAPKRHGGANARRKYGKSGRWFVIIGSTKIYRANPAASPWVASFTVLRGISLTWHQWRQQRVWETLNVTPGGVKIVSTLLTGSYSSSCENTWALTRIRDRMRRYLAPNTPSELFYFLATYLPNQKEKLILLAAIRTGNPKEQYNDVIYCVDR